MTPEAEMFLARNSGLIREAFREMERENAQFDLELEQACVDLAREADYVSCASSAQLAAQRSLIEEARDHLNAALAKADRIKVAA